jgi:hypothetical protein
MMYWVSLLAPLLELKGLVQIEYSSILTYNVREEGFKSPYYGAGGWGFK